MVTFHHNLENAVVYSACNLMVITLLGSFWRSQHCLAASAILLALPLPKSMSTGSVGVPLVYSYLSNIDKSEGAAWQQRVKHPQNSKQKYIKRSKIMHLFCRFVVVCDKCRRKRCEVNIIQAKDKSFQSGTFIKYTALYIKIHYFPNMSSNNVWSGDVCNYDKVHKERRNSVYVRDKHC